MEEAYYRTAGKKPRKEAPGRESGRRGGRSGSGAKTANAEAAVKARRRRKILRRCAVVLAACTLLLAVFSKLFEAPAAAAAEKEAERLALELINSAVLETMDEYEAEGGTSGFTSQRVNEDGVGFLYVDSGKINLMSARIIEKLNAKIAALRTAGIDLPLGTILGAAAFNGLGPHLTAAIRPVGSIKRDYSASFSAAGVNQTLYSASLRIEVELLVLFGGAERTVRVSCSAPLVETVIIGGVPHAYTDVSTLDEALNLIPTDAE